MKSKLFVTILVSLLATGLYAQKQDMRKHNEGIAKSIKKNTVFLSMDTVYDAGSAAFLYNMKEGVKGPYGKTEYYAVFNFQSKDTLMRVIRNSSAFYEQCGMMFPQIKYRFDASMSIEKIIKAMMEDKAVIGGKISMEGLKTMCAKNNLKLMTYPEYDNWVKEYEAQQAEKQEAAKNQPSQNNPSYSSPQNTSSSGSAKQPSSTQATSLPKNVSFTLKNNSSKTVRIFIGTKPKYGSGRTTNLGGNSITSEHGTAGDQICVVDGSDNPISCQTISGSVTRIDINSSGTGFGY
ncbi:MAG: hypothetical protein EPN85_08210 [Bacteroidetes bacterium]|nr:MAG: hypothetical protein EPN85_08210 [Bacteroidota bacterium]